MDNFEFRNKIKKLNFKKIFLPTDTSRLLINASKKYLKKKQSILDLGCGGGVVTYFLYNSRLKQHFFLSDIHDLAINRAIKNLKKKNINATFRSGSLFKPWVNQKFDLIINDVSGVSSKISKISKWFKYAPSDNTNSGISNLKKIVKDSNKFVKKNSLIILPIISLSNVSAALKYTKKNLNVINEEKYYWPMPSELQSKIKYLKKLKKQNHIKFDFKYNKWLCYTLILVCKKK